MFAPGDTTTKPIATSAQPEVVTDQQEESTSALQSPVEYVTGLELNGANAGTKEDSAPEAPTEQKRQTKETSSPASSRQSKKPSATKKQSKAPDTWHQYVTGEFSNVSLAKAVAQVMQQHEKKVV